ncbi:MAG: GNAT family N-acetyltransferase [Pseudomonadales bacterium]|nr:GNAT family N-acetyltransferase [Pseudomonadales bacterium]
MQNQLKTIHIANTNQQMSLCCPVMQELRPSIKTDDFIARIKLQQESGYQLAFIQQRESAVAVAGFRINQNLTWGRFLYIDDLVTGAAYRSNGYGSQMLNWLKGYAKEMHCDEIHLDSGLQRLDAHRFYEREGMPKTSYHFATSV